MIPTNPHYVRHLMAEREREIEKVRTMSEIRRARRTMPPPAVQRGRSWRQIIATAMVLGLLSASITWIHIEIPPVTWARNWR